MTLESGTLEQAMALWRGRRNLNIYGGYLRDINGGKELGQKSRDTDDGGHVLYTVAG